MVLILTSVSTCQAVANSTCVLQHGQLPRVRSKEATGKTQSKAGSKDAVVYTRQCNTSCSHATHTLTALFNVLTVISQHALYNQHPRTAHYFNFTALLVIGTGTCSRLLACQFTTSTVKSLVDTQYIHNYGHRCGLSATAIATQRMHYSTLHTYTCMCAQITNCYKMSSWMIPMIHHFPCSRVMNFIRLHSTFSAWWCDSSVCWSTSTCFGGGTGVVCRPGQPKVCGTHR